jgi:hypothetical protein
MQRGRLWTTRPIWSLRPSLKSRSSLDISRANLLRLRPLNDLLNPLPLPPPDETTAALLLPATATPPHRLQAVEDSRLLFTSTSIISIISCNDFLFLLEVPLPPATLPLPPTSLTSILVTLLHLFPQFLLLFIDPPLAMPSDRGPASSLPRLSLKYTDGNQPKKRRGAGQRRSEGGRRGPELGGRGSGGGVKPSRMQ